MRVIGVNYISGYKLKLLFSNKKKKIVDLEDDLKKAKGVFLPLKDIEYFKKVSVDDCHLSICWPNGADLCPDVLYEMGKEITTKHKESKKENIKSQNKIKKQRAA